MPVKDSAADDSAQRRLLAWQHAWLDHALVWHDDVSPAPRFDEATVYLPRRFAQPGSLQLARAAIAHIAAHQRYGGARFTPGSLKPIQQVLISLIEDARVEHLAMAERPGLRDLWQPFHQPAAATDVPGLLSRLAAALFHLDIPDSNFWVDKGRRLFLHARAEWHLPSVSRRIGGLLGNDLGQMRLPYDARTHQPECSYRDDHYGLWTSDEPSEAAGLAQRAPRQPKTGGDLAALVQAGALVNSGTGSACADGQAASEIMELPEWDYARNLLRPSWARLHEEAPCLSESASIDALLAARESEVRTLARGLSEIRRQRRRRRREHLGDDLDLDACVEHFADRRAGHMPGRRVYLGTRALQRDLALLLLLDASRSTATPITPDCPSVLEVERDAAAMLAYAAGIIGDPCAITAFRSAGRRDVRLCVLQDFSAEDAPATRAALAGLEPGLSTRLGAALRGAGRKLARWTHTQRWLITISDFDVADIDVPDPQYLVEDARHAVAELSREGITAFGTGLSPAAAPALRRIFGRHAMVLETPDRLGSQLLRVYRRLGQMAG